MKRNGRPDTRINTERCIEFLTLLVQGAERKIILIVDNLRVHHAKQVKQWLSDRKDRIELVFLPPYAPDSNPDEYLNRDFKTAQRNGAMSHGFLARKGDGVHGATQQAPRAGQG